MTIAGVLRPAALLLVLALAACADPATGGSSPAPPPSPSAELPDEADALVLRVEHVGGFTTAAHTVSRLPGHSVYADGRMITDGPVPAIYPGPALPNVQVARLDPDQVQQLVERAVAAGVTGTADLGSPPIADATTARFTLTTADGTYVREVYALDPFGSAGDGLTDEQRAGREALADLVTALEDLVQQEYAAGTPPEEYVPSALAVVGRPWVDPQDGLAQPVADWPGPPLPGEPAGALPDVGCVVVDGEQTAVLLEAARSANAATPWRTADGSLWSVHFRPLLPDEATCADLVD